MLDIPVQFHIVKQLSGRSSGADLRRWRNAERSNEQMRLCLAS